MNYRYLYRAKRTDNGEWILGSLIQASYLGSIRSWISSEQEDKARLREISSNKAVWREFEVRTDTICQCTSLKDKNGKLIWENDILMQKTNEKHWCKWKCSGVVKYGEYDYNAGEYGYKSIGFYVEPIIKNGDTTRIWCGLNQEYLVDECYPYEVIGNIFDNPELLEN